MVKFSVWGWPHRRRQNLDSALDSGGSDTQSQDTQDTQDTQGSDDTGDTSDSAEECGIDNLQFRAEVRNNGAPCENNTCTQPFAVVGVVLILVRKPLSCP